MNFINDIQERRTLYVLPLLLGVWDRNCEGNAQCVGGRVELRTPPAVESLSFPPLFLLEDVAQGITLFGGHVNHKVHQLLLQPNSW